jgi:hypothetical protein
VPSRVEITALLVIIGVVIMVAVLARSLFINARTLLRDRNRSLDGFRTGLERQATKMLDGLLHPDDASPPDRGRSG